ncbi:MAG: hypothetical protein P8Y02_01355 [Deinococcales bacterium]
MRRIQLRYVLLAVTALGLLVWGAAVTIPNSFSDGDVISASEMNANFAAVKAAVDANEAAVASLQKGPTVFFEDLVVGSITVDASHHVCQTPGYTASASERAIVHVQLSVSASSAQTFSSSATYSSNGGTTFSFLNGSFAPVTIPAGGYGSGSLTAAVDLTEGTTYVFAATPEPVLGSSAFTGTVRCHVVAEIVKRDPAQTLSVLSARPGGDR